MAEKQAPDLSQAQEREWMTGAEWLNWRNHEKTQELLAWIREALIGTAQDRWANGGFSTWEANLMGQGGTMALASLVDTIENIKMDEQPQQEREDEQ